MFRLGKHLRGYWYQAKINQNAGKLQKSDCSDVPAELFLPQVAGHHANCDQPQKYGDCLAGDLNNCVVGDGASGGHVSN